MSAAVTAPAPVAIDGTLADMRPITPRFAVQQAVYALEYIYLYGFFDEALKGNEHTQGASVVRREIAKTRTMLLALLAS